MVKSRREYIYGINACTEVVRSGRRRVHRAFLDRKRASHPRIRPLVQMLESKHIPLDWVDNRRLTELSSHTDHQGAVLRTRPYSYQSLEKLWGRPRVLLLDSVEDPQNVGAILRSAEIFGFDAILLAQKGVPDVLPSVVKVASGATEFLQIAKERSAADYARAAKQNGYQIVALDAHGSVDIRDMESNLSDKVLLVIGGENRGISKGVLDRSDFVVSIRQSGRINSLNASVAAGIALFSLRHPDGRSVPDSPQHDGKKRRRTP